MKTYRIRFKGQVYEVDVEEVQDSGNHSLDTKTVTPLQKVENTVTESPKPVTEGQPVVAPMPGMIVTVQVQEGDQVQVGQILFILEAMKMENEIVAPAAGRVKTVKVNKGATVGTGDVLLVLA